MRSFQDKKINLLFVVPMHITWESFLNPAHNSRTYQKKDGNLYNSLSTDLPLGPLSMSAYLKKHIKDINVKLIDFNAEINCLDRIEEQSFEEIAIKIFSETGDFIPNIIGISSLFSPSFHNFIACASAAKIIFSNALIIGGGNIPTNSYQYIYGTFKNKNFDALCIGEGEKPLLQLLRATDLDKYLLESSSWVTPSKISNGMDFIPKHDFIENLDDIPFFDYDLCDFEKHSTNMIAQTGFHSVDKKRTFHIMTSRGCPFLCTFCASHKTHGRTMRYHSVKRVKRDIETLVTRYDAGTIVFQDDHLMADKNRVKQLLEIVKANNVESLYQNGLTLYALDYQMLVEFYEANVRHLVLPVESGSERVLKKEMRKPLKLRISEEVAWNCREIGIYTNTNILIGMPGETKADLHEGKLNLRRVKTNWFNIACASPIVGSEMREQAEEKGYIYIENLGADYRKATIATNEFTTQYIQDFQYEMNLDLNFVNNSDIELGEYNVALMALNNVSKIRPDHAFSHYFRAKCYFGLGDIGRAKACFDKYLTYSQNKFWSTYVSTFDLCTDFKKFSSEKYMPAENRLFSKIKGRISI